MRTYTLILFLLLQLSQSVVLVVMHSVQDHSHLKRVIRSSLLFFQLSQPTLSLPFHHLIHTTLLPVGPQFTHMITVLKLSCIIILL